MDLPHLCTGWGSMGSRVGEVHVLELHLAPVVFRHRDAKGTGSSKLRSGYQCYSVGLSLTSLWITLASPGLSSQGQITDLPLCGCLCGHVESAGKPEPDRGYEYVTKRIEGLVDV